MARRICGARAALAGVYCECSPEPLCIPTKSFHPWNLNRFLLLRMCSTPYICTMCITIVAFYAWQVIDCRLCITLNCQPHQKEKGQPPLLLPRRKRSRPRPTPHRPSGLSGHRRKTSCTRPAKGRPRPPLRHLARLRPPRRLMAGRKTVRPVAAAGIPVARAAFRTRSCSLPPPRGHSPHL